MIQYRSAGVFLFGFAGLNAVAQYSHTQLERRRAAEMLIDGRLQAPVEQARYDQSVGEDLERYWPRIPNAREHRLAVLVGMSQMYSINDPMPNDRIISERLDDTLSPLGTRVFGMAAPNLNNEEALFYLLATASRPATRPELFIYGVCFDKFRNTDLRPALQLFLSHRPELAREWQNVASRYRLKYPLASEKMLASATDMATAAANIADDSFEAHLRAHVAGLLPLVDARKVINAQIFSSLFNLRNSVLRIKASTKRPIIGARYELNRELLELLLDEAKALGVQPLPYIIPLNRMSETPYVESEYSSFKQWFGEYTTANRVPHADLDSVVPAEDWGTRNGEPDFKHFKGEGHRKTAEAIFTAFGSELVKNSR